MSGAGSQKQAGRIGLLEVFIPCFYILNQYQVGSVSLGLLTMILVIFLQLRKKREFILYKPLLFLTLFMIIHDLMKALLLMNGNLGILNTWLERIVYFIFLMQCFNRVDEEWLYKVWKYIGILAMAGIFYQAFLVYVRGQSVQMIRILPLLSDSISFTKVYPRPRSFFLEPAAYVTWILPLLYMALKRKKYVFSALVTFTILLSTSTTGVLMSIALWGLMIWNRKSISLKKKIGMIILLIICLPFIFSLPVFQKTVEKISNTDFTSNLRVTAGIQIYKDADLSTKLFGIRYNSTKEYFLNEISDLEKYNMVKEATWLGFVNALAGSLLMYGILGGILYLYLFYRVLRDGVSEINPYLIICLISILGQGVFYNAFFVMQFAVLLGINKISRNVIGVNLQ